MAEVNSAENIGSKLARLRREKSDVRSETKRARVERFDGEQLANARWSERGEEGIYSMLRACAHYAYSSCRRKRAAASFRCACSPTKCALSNEELASVKSEYQVALTLSITSRS